MDSDMTPISRLIPQTSGSHTPHRSERETIRENVGGPAMTPPIRPEPSGDVHGDDIVSEILRDTEEPSHSQGNLPPNNHPSQYQEQEYPEESYSPSPNHPSHPQRSVRFEDDEPPTRTRAHASKKEENEGETDYIGLILNEMKLPLIVAVLILGASSTGLDGTITKLLPAFLNMGGSGGMVLKAIVGGLLFYVLHRIFL